jgi:hypothetical protein
MKIIFLDIDGVLNCEDAYKNGFCRKNDEYGQDFYPPSSNLLNQLIEETGAKVVVSSTWRHSGEKIMKEMWNHRKMAGEVIGVTPSMSFSTMQFIIDGKEVDFYPCRGDEIKTWLNMNGFSQCFWSEEFQQESIEKSGIENFIIIDDDSDFLYNQRQHFVHVKPSPRNKKGFHEGHYKQAKEILETPLMKLYGFV